MKRQMAVQLDRQAWVAMDLCSYTNRESITLMSLLGHVALPRSESK